LWLTPHSTDAINRNHQHLQILGDAMRLDLKYALEFRVIASNKAGDSVESNSVAVMV
jgi:hypothetical protein